jgi:RimJ/RimL family protein N-acetyltransferase
MTGAARSESISASPQWATALGAAGSNRVDRCIGSPHTVHVVTSLKLNATLLSNDRLLLEPLRVEHADEMTAVLADASLYSFIGGSAPTVAELRRRYSRQVLGTSKDGTEGWLNWIIRLRADRAAAGFVQATVTHGGAALQADVAWLVGTSHQGHGYAQEAAVLMTDWLRQSGVATITAHVHPDHRASAVVAQRIGLTPTEHVEDGEVRWQG